MKGILTLKKLAVIAAVCIAVLCILGCSSESESELGNYAPIAVDSVWIYTSALTLKPGESYTLSASVMPDNADDKTVRWSSSNTLIATVGVNNFLIIRVIFLCFLFKKGFFPGTGRANFSLRGLSSRKPLSKRAVSLVFRKAV